MNLGKEAISLERSICLRYPTNTISIVTLLAGLMALGLIAHKTPPRQELHKMLQFLLVVGLLGETVQLSAMTMNVLAFPLMDFVVLPRVAGLYASGPLAKLWIPSLVPFVRFEQPFDI